MIKLQQSKALTSNLERFWSIVINFESSQINKMAIIFGGQCLVPLCALFLPSFTIRATFDASSLDHSAIKSCFININLKVVNSLERHRPLYSFVGKKRVFFVGWKTFFCNRSTTQHLLKILLLFLLSKAVIHLNDTFPFFVESRQTEYQISHP